MGPLPCAPIAEHEIILLTGQGDTMGLFNKLFGHDGGNQITSQNPVAKAVPIGF